MTISIPKHAEKFGFVIDGYGAHSGRTIMLSDLRSLLDAAPPSAEIDEYEALIRKENVLLKNTDAAKKESFQRLRRLYGLDPEILLFNILRQLWSQSTDAQPMLALLYAIARDPLLRSTVDLIVELPIDERISASDFSETISNEFPSELSQNTLASIGRNIASSYTQSGHIIGRSIKKRVRVESHVPSITYALLLGHLCDEKGEGLFHTPWIRLLDTSTHELHSKTQLASQQGWLTYRQSGEIIEVSFSHLLEEVEL